MELTPTPGVQITNASPDDQIDTVRRIKIIKVDTPAATANLKTSKLKDSAKVEKVSDKVQIISL